MELVTVGGKVREIKFEDRGEVSAARLCFRARAIQAYLQPREDPLGEQTTPGPLAKRDRELSACNAAATALHDRRVTSFVVRGDDVPLLHGVLTEDSGSIPKGMTEPTVVEMTEREFELYASYSRAHTINQGVLQSPRTA